jgi:hypothetical protein
MNRDDINKLWAVAYVNGMLPFEQREKFARLIAAAEREACAKVLEGISNAPDMQAYANAIRARGEQEQPR